MKKDSRNLSVSARDRARGFRKEMSVSEKWFWEMVRKKRMGEVFRRQVAIGPYFLDFYCAAASLCVEIDGEQHLDRREKDRRRDEYLADKGIYTLRIPSLDLFDELGMKKASWELEVRRLVEERSMGKD